MTRSFVVALIAGLAALAGAPATGRAQSNREVLCESQAKDFKYCPVATRGSVRVVRTLSETQCILNRTWGYDAKGIWVDRGCRARFLVAGSGGGGESGGNVVTCASQSGRYEFCRAATRGDVRLSRQLSREPCVAGQTWGFQKDGIWVANGCRAEFEVGYNDITWENGQRHLTCESEDGRYRRCRTWTYGTVRVARQLSKTDCVLRSNWGYDKEGIWVNDGCRAVFAVGTATGGGGWGMFAGGTGGSNEAGSGSWSELRTRAYTSCANLAGQRGFRSVRMSDAERRSSGDVWVVLIGNLGSKRYKVSCLYYTQRGRSDIMGQQVY
jgi:hypothetical protein